MSHKATAYAQIILSILFLVGYFWVLTDFIHGKIQVAPEWKDQLGILLGVLTGSIPNILAYWFQRQRTSAEDAK